MNRLVLATLAILFAAASGQARGATPEDARATTKEATIYGFPMVDNYRVLYSYFVDKGGPEYKAPWNTLVNNARVYTPDDTAIQTPNSDTPYSYAATQKRTPFTSTSLQRRTTRRPFTRST